MGEISESMINGEFCQSCGVYIGEATGYPRNCSGCNPRKRKDKHYGKNGKKHELINKNVVIYNSLPKRP